MHHRLTEHGRCCYQNNQLPTESHVELQGLHQFGNQDTFQALTIWTRLEMMVILLHHHLERNPIPDS